MQSDASPAPQKRFDVFLCHNSKDKEVLRDIDERLRDEGNLRTWFDELKIPAGEPWQPVIQAALASCNGCAVFLSGHGWGSGFHLEEARLCIALRSDQFRVIVVLLEGARLEESNLLGDDISALSVVNLRQGANLDVEFHRLIRAVHPAPETLPPVEDVIRLSPYLIRRSAALWKRTLHSRDLLWRGKQLADAQALAQYQRDNLNEVAWEFLNACQQEVVAERRRIRRRAAIAIGLLSLALLLVTVLAVSLSRQKKQLISTNGQLESANQEVTRQSAEKDRQKGRAEDATKEAVKNAEDAKLSAEEARGRELAAVAAGLRGDDSWELRILLAAEAVRRSTGSEATRIALEQTADRLDVKATLRDTIGWSKSYRYLGLNPSPGAAVIWDRSTGRRVAHVQHGASIEFVRFDRRETFATISWDDGYLTVVHLPDGHVLYSLENGGTSDLQISPAATWFATKHYKDRVEIRTAANGSVFREILFDGGEASMVWTMAFDDNGRYFAAGTQNGIVKVADLLHRGEDITVDLRCIQGNSNNRQPDLISHLAFDLDSKLLAIASWSGKIVLLDLLTAKSRLVCLLDDLLLHMTFSPGGRFLATAGQDGKSVLIDIARSTPRPPLSFSGAVVAIVFNQDGSRFIAAGQDGTLRAVPLPAGAPIRTTELGRPLGDCGLGVSGTLMTCLDESGVSVLEAANFGTLARFSMDHIREADFARSDSVVGVPSKSTMYLLGSTGRSVLATTRLDVPAITAALDRDARTMAVAGGLDDGRQTPHRLRVVDGRDSRILVDTQIGGVGDLAFQPGGDRLAITNPRLPMVEFFSLTTKDWLPNERVTEGYHSLNSFQFSRDGRLAALATMQGHFRILDLKTPSRSWNGHVTEWKHDPTPLYDLQFSPDRQLLAAVSVSEVRVQDLASKRVLWRRSSGRGGFASACFSPGSTRLAYTAMGESVLADARTGKRITLVESDANRTLCSPSDDLYAFVSASSIRLARGDRLETVTELYRDVKEDLIRSGLFAFDPTGRWFVELGKNGIANIIDTVTLRVVRKEFHGAALAMTWNGPDHVAVAIATTKDPNRVDLISIPATQEGVLSELCRKPTRNLTREEWSQYLPAVPYRATCPNLPAATPPE